MLDVPAVETIHEEAPSQDSELVVQEETTSKVVEDTDDVPVIVSEVNIY